MAMLGDVCMVLSLKGNNTVFGVESHADIENVVITFTSRQILTFNITDKKTLKDWSLRSSARVTCPAVANLKNNGYLIILNDEILQMWNDENMVIEKSKKLKLKKPAFKLFSFPGLDPLIIYKDGTLAWLDDANSVIGENILQSNEHVSCCSAVTLQEAVFVVVLYKDQDTKLHRICLYEIQKDSDEMKLSKFDLDEGNAELLSCQLHGEGSSLQLFIFLSDGQLIRKILTGPGRETIRQTLPPTNKHPHFCVLDDTHIAIAGILSKSGQEGLGIWDNKFSLLQAWQPFPEQGATVKQMFHQKQQLFVACGKGLYVMEYSIKPSTVGAVLGKIDSLCGTGAVGPEKVTDDLPPSLFSLLDIYKTSTHKKFKECFHAFNKWFDSHPEKICSISSYMTRLVTRCLQEKHFWPGEEIRHLITYGLIDSTQCTSLFAVLSEREEIDLLQSALLHIRDIPESCLVTCLKCYLSCADEKFSKKRRKEDIEDATECPIDKNKATYITRVLECSYNDVFLLESLRKLDFDQSLVLLKYLLHLLQDVPMPEEDRETSALSLSRVVSWISILLDAHFTHLILSPDARKPLAALHEIIQEKMGFYEDLVGLEGILEQLKEKCSLPPKQHIGLYCIETLHIS